MPVSLPLTALNLNFFEVEELYPKLSVTIGLTNGTWFEFNTGRICRFHDAFALHDQFPKKDHFQRKAAITRSEALTLVRRSIESLGYSLEDLYMNLDRDFKQWPWDLPHYEFTWYFPNTDGSNDPTPAVTIEIDAANKRILYLNISPLLFVGNPEPDIPGLKEAANDARRQQALKYAPQVPLEQPEVERAQLLEALPKLAAFVEAVRLPINRSQASEVRTAKMEYSTGVPLIGIQLTNGYSFVYNQYKKRVEGFNDGKSFFGTLHPRLKDYVGERKISEKVATDLVIETLKRLQYNTSSLLTGRPRVQTPNVRKVVVPRVELSWKQSSGGIISRAVYAEVDLGSGQIAALTIIDE